MLHNNSQASIYHIKTSPHFTTSMTITANLQAASSLVSMKAQSNVTLGLPFAGLVLL
jgi:hypothetical protein